MSNWFMGIDPGAKGAIAVYDKEDHNIVRVWDIPTFRQTIGRSKKLRVDAPELAKILEACREMGVELCVLEEVGGIPKQSAPHAFTFGWSCGLVYMGLVQNRFAIDPVRPALWKKVLKCGKDLEEIHHRAKEMFPKNDDLWTTPRGAVKDGRCEAAMLAFFAAHHAYGKTEPGAETRILK